MDGLLYHESYLLRHKRDSAYREWQFHTINEVLCVAAVRYIESGDIFNGILSADFVKRRLEFHVCTLENTQGLGGLE